MLIVGVLLWCGCSERPPTGPESGWSFFAQSGDQQLGRARAPLDQPLTVRLVEQGTLAPVRGVRVRFALARPEGATLDDSTVLTDADGFARTRLTLGAAGTTAEVRAWLAVAPERLVTFMATAQADASIVSITPSTLRGGDTVTVTGENLFGAVSRVHFGDASADVLVSTSSSVSTVRAVVPYCLAAGATPVSVELDGLRTNTIVATASAPRQPIALVPFARVTLPAARAAECASFAGAGAKYLVTASFGSVGSPDPVEWQLGAPGVSAQAVTSVPALRTVRERGSRRDFDERLRALEASLAPAVRAERVTSQTHMSNLAVAAPAVGSTRDFRVVASLDGTRFTIVRGELRYAGERVLFYMDEEYNDLPNEQVLGLARLYDRDLHRIAIDAFGAEPDVDGDGRVMVLLTPAVNRLVPADECILRGVVTGFFYPVDQMERDPNSNRGEIFYGYVPDPAGQFGCEHSEVESVRALQSQFLHEMQHLISFNQRVLARNVAPEEGWLAEGLSQVAEELGSKLFEARYPAPLGRSTTVQLFPDSAAPFIAPQLLNAYVYLSFNLDNSVTSFTAPGRLENRGGAWLFMRWLADQMGEGILKRLVESPRSGIENIEAAAREPFRSLFADFSATLVADSVPGVPRFAIPGRLRFTSRNLRQLMAREAVVAGFSKPFPLTTYSLVRGGSLRSAMPAGTMIHALLETAPADGPFAIAFTAPGGTSLPPALAGQVTVMRVP